MSRRVDQLLLQARRLFSAFFTMVQGESGVLLGQPIEVRDPAVALATVETLEAELPAERAVARLGGSELSAALWIVLPVADAMALGSMVLALPPEVARQKVEQRDITDMDADSFGEIGNQLCGLLNRVIETTLVSQRVHLRQLGSELRPPAPGAEPAPWGEAVYVHAGAALKHPLGPGRLSVLLPLGACGPLLGATISVEEAMSALRPSPAADGSGPARPVLVLACEEAATGKMIESYLAGDAVTVVALPASVEALAALRDHRIDYVVVETAGPDAGLRLCDRIQRMAGRDVPAMVCAGNWTAADVQQALQRRVREIVVKPIRSAQLVSKLRRLLG